MVPAESTIRGPRAANVATSPPVDSHPTATTKRTPHSRASATVTVRGHSPAAEKPHERHTRPERFLVVGLYQRQAQEHRIAGHIGGKQPASPEVTNGIDGASRTGQQE
jgi:hypothetical protein